MKVNADRKVIMGQVIETNENFTREDLPKIRRVFGKLNREYATRNKTESLRRAFSK